RSRRVRRPRRSSHSCGAGAAPGTATHGGPDAAKPQAPSEPYSSNPDPPPPPGWFSRVSEGLLDTFPGQPPPAQHGTHWDPRNWSESAPADEPMLVMRHSAVTGRDMPAASVSFVK